MNRYTTELRQIQAEKQQWSIKAAENAKNDAEYHDRCEALINEKNALLEEREAAQGPLKRWLTLNAKLGKTRTARLDRVRLGLMVS